MAILALQRVAAFPVAICGAALARRTTVSRLVGGRAISSFREYLLVAQERPHVIQYVRQANDKWLRTDIEGLHETLTLETINCALTLAEIYRRVEFQSGKIE